jgi:single-stranded-DNA-specific exonuclease
VNKYRLRERAHPELLKDLLHARGVVGEENIEQFLTPDFQRDSHDPFLLPDMAQAVERIVLAKKREEHVGVWSDYDCDGVPGGVMLTEFLRAFGLKVTHYIPHRHKEGYGLNVGGIDALAAAGVTLMITVDLGTTNISEIAHARTKGIETIVTDHHIVHGELPQALVLNPKRPESKYPFDGLCGAGVAWKLVQAILVHNRPDDFAEGQEKWLLDLVGLATLSDMVPLRGENRMLAHYGLVVMRRARRPGLAALLNILRIKPGTLTEDDVGFMVAPRINAASRMDAPDAASKLLGCTSAEEARELARALNKINDERKGVVAATVKEVHKRLSGSAQAESPVIVMGSPAWRPGVLGLVANSLAESHGKPVCLWGREGGEVMRGSCRGVGDINIVEWMQAAGDVFDHFGGHAGSGGFSVNEEKIHELPERMAASYELLRAKGTAAPEVTLDREVDLAEVSHARRDLMRLAPFGEGNRKPLLVFPNVSIGTIKMFGKEQNHLELSLTRGDSRYSGVSFFSTVDSFSKPIIEGEKSDIVGHIETDWNGRPRLRVVDVI